MGKLTLNSYFVLCFFFFSFLALHRPAYGKNHKLHSVIVLSSRDKKKQGGVGFLFKQVINLDKT